MDTQIQTPAWTQPLARIHRYQYLQFAFKRPLQILEQLHDYVDVVPGDRDKDDATPVQCVVTFHVEDEFLNMLFTDITFPSGHIVRLMSTWDQIDIPEQLPGAHMDAPDSTADAREVE